VDRPAHLDTLGTLAPACPDTLDTVERRLNPVTLDTQDSPGTLVLEFLGTPVLAYPATLDTVDIQERAELLELPDTLDTQGQGLLVILDTQAMPAP